MAGRAVLFAAVLGLASAASFEVRKDKKTATTCFSRDDRGRVAACLIRKDGRGAQCAARGCCAEKKGSLFLFQRGRRGLSVRPRWRRARGDFLPIDRCQQDWGGVRRHRHHLKIQASKDLFLTGFVAKRWGISSRWNFLFASSLDKLPSKAIIVSSSP